MSADRAIRPVLSASSVGRDYDGYMALGAFSVEVQVGEMVAVVGPNGAGKSTFLAIAAGLLAPTSGQVQVDGARAGSLAARAAVSYLPDTPVFYEDLSFDEHLEYIAALHGADQDGARAAQLKERLELAEWGDSLPAEFSRGMRQKASIALALVRPFSVLLADEPFDALDPASREALFALLTEARGEGAAILLSTHRRDVLTASDRCLALSEGRLVFDGSPEDGEVESFFS